MQWKASWVAAGVLLLCTLPAMADPQDGFALPAPFKVAMPAPGTPAKVEHTAPLTPEAPPPTPQAPAVAAPTLAPPILTPASTPSPSASPPQMTAPSANPVTDQVQKRAERNHEMLTHAVILAGLFSMDVSLNNSFQRNGGVPLISEKTAGPLFLMGDGATDLAFAEAMHMFGGSQRSRDAGSASVRAILNAGINVQLLKTLFGRSNPGFGQPQAQFTGPQLLAGHDSFPSGHTCSAFAFATAMSHYYPQHKTLYYTLATITGISTLARHVHWASDVYAGALLGIVSGNEAINRTPNFFMIKF